MAIAAKRLGVSKPSATTATILYTVPASTEAYLSVYCVNQSDTLDQIRVALVEAAGTVDWTTDSFIHDADLDRDAPIVIVSIAADTDEDIVIYSTNGTTSFIATGIERT
tara:strand:- start:1043 stop:1369 length:327 start_codon:yes stop_codon:yes gene_type:complete